MFITRMALPRRTFLKGMGVSFALPLLDAMVPALSATAQTAANPVRRLGFIYLANGVSMSLNNGINYWKPKVVGPLGELTEILAPFGPYRDQLTVISRMTHLMAAQLGDGGNGDHTRATSTWLNGVKTKHTAGADVRAGRTADQIAASVIGKDTPLRSLELMTDLNYLMGSCDNGYSCLYMNTLAWLTPTTPLPTETNPRVVFEKLFGEGGTPAQRRAAARQNGSILDWVTGEMGRLKGMLAPADQTKLDDYFESVREIETRIQRTETQNTESMELPLERPTAIPTRFDEHVRVLFDLQWLAFRSDTTRVVTFMLGRELGSRSFAEIGVPDPHHGLSHHRDEPEIMARYAKVGVYQAEQVAYFLNKLRSTPEGDGTLLDHSQFLYGAGLSDSNAHAHRDLPLCVIGGGAKRHHGGQHLAASVDEPMTNLLLTMLDTAGVPADTLGDSTGRLQLEPFEL